ncbi:MAG TPA: hypothetical protein VHP33_32985 [Polyangiaceae bacterium]|nr:hypothetical protein [Polyangiaceae bacterium]
MPSSSWTRKHYWMVAGAAVIASLAGCSDDSGGGPATGGSAGAAGSTVTAGSATTAGSGGALATGGSAGSSTGGKASGGSGGTGAPKTNCGDLTCTSSEICISSDPFFVGEESNECAPPPAGCSINDVCGCNLADWKGSPISGCVGFVPPTLYVYDLSCGDAPCAAGMVCLIDDSEAKPPSCVAAPNGCTIDKMFCDADCAKQVAMTAGMEYAGCKASSVGVGVTVRPL